MPTRSPLLLISNPKCGDGKGHAFVMEHVLPLLADHDVRVDKEVVTNAPGHAALAFVDFVNEHWHASHVSLILASGDGTLHEIINAVYSAALDRPLHISVALVPTGTANALYSSFFLSAQAGGITMAEHKLRSVNALLENGDNIVPLTIAKATVRSPARTVAAVHFSAVVTSTALHASILHDSESLREQVPDLSRFKIAAEKNITRWYNGVVKFRPIKGSEVAIYDHRTGKFVRFVGDEKKLAEPTMYGPFAYFLSTVNVDRLEPSFVISPLRRILRPDSDSMDIVVIRPHRDPTIHKNSDAEEDHLCFAAKVGLALRSAYRDGSHVNLTYSDDGTVQESDERGSLSSIVEYIRCAGSWRWLNTGIESAYLCVDGTIVNIKAGGEVECETVKSSSLNFGIFV